MAYPIFHSQYTAAQIEGSIGKSPRIKAATRTWEIWDISTGAYVDTGVSIDTELFVDSTLTEAGYASDAKVTGDKIGDLKSAIENLADGYEIFTPVYEDGDINSVGEEVASTTWVRSDYIPIAYMLNAQIKISFTHDYYYANFVLYDSNKDYVAPQTHKTSDFVYDLYASGAYYVRIVLPKAESDAEYFSILAFAKWENETVTYNEKITINLGAELITTDGHWDSDNWSGNNTDGYTHPVGKSGVLSFYGIGIEQNSNYLLEFDTDYDSDEFVAVGIGSQYKNLAYNGDTHIIMPLHSDTGTTLYFQPFTNVAFTISNISLKKIDANASDTKTLTLYRTITPNHAFNKGFWNILMGEHSMENSIGSTRCLALGYGSMKALQGGHRNIGVGTFTMSQMTGGENNIAVGADAMLALTEGDENIAIGKGAMYLGRKMNNNIAIGPYALTGKANSYGTNNVSIGRNSGYKCSNSDNVFVGYQAGYNVEGGGANVIIGSNAYGQATGDYNIAIGRNATYSNGVSNSIAIGKNASTTKSNQVVIGNGDTEELVIGNKKIIFYEDGSVKWESI